LATEDDGSCIYAGGSCDDGDPNTSNDVYDNNCVCAGVVGVLEWSTAAGMTIYPNPAESTLTLQWVGNVSGSVLVDVCDLTGKVVKSFSRQIHAQQAMQIDIVDLANGLYQMRAKSEQGVMVRQFVKQ
jgi:Secretion system C-terminal sorting domain